MDFDWTDEQRALREATAAAIGADHGAAPQALEQADLRELGAILRAQLTRLAERSYLTEGLQRLAAQELLASHSPSLFLAVETSTTIFGDLLAELPGDELCGRLLGLLRAGRLLGAVASADGPDGAPPELGPTIATRDGQDLVLHGRKPFVTNGPLADWFAVVAQLDGDAPRRSVVCLLDASTPGLLRSPRIETLGYRGLAVCSLELTGVRVPAAQVLGSEGAEPILARLRAREDLCLAQASVGVAQRSFDAARSHARSHKRDGKPIERRQQVAFSLAEMLTLLQSAQWLVRRAAWAWAEGTADADALLGCAKVFAAEAAERVARLGLQLSAGAGYTTGSVAEAAHRDACFTALAGTTSERCRMSIAADLLEGP